MNGQVFLQIRPRFFRVAIALWFLCVSAFVALGWNDGSKLAREKDVADARDAAIVQLPTELHNIHLELRRTVKSTKLSPPD